MSDEPYRPPKHSILVNSGELITEQHHAEHLDPARLATKLLNGEINPATLATPRYGDQTGPQTLQAMLELLEERREFFMSQNARVRQLCGNDLMAFERAQTNREDLARLVDAGLVVADDVREDLEPELAALAPAEAPEPDPEPAKRGPDPLPVLSTPGAEPAAQPAE